VSVLLLSLDETFEESETVSDGNISVDLELAVLEQ
jgi:hypothetical protein